MNAVGSYGVHYSDVDQNRHMNNTRYPDMYSSFIDMSGKYIRSITLNYRAEAMLGEKLRVERALNESGYLFRTVRADGQINSEAQIVLDDIG
jgi:acyl-ACP thioesterase